MAAWRFERETLVTEIRFRVLVPRVPAGLAVSNLLGLVGLVAVAVAVGGLTGTWWWSVLVAGVFAVGLAAVAQLGTVRATESTGGGRLAAVPKTGAA